MTDPDPDLDAPSENETPEEYAKRRALWANKASRGVLAAVLCLEALTVLLVPRTIAFTTGLGPARLTIIFTLAGVLVVAAGLLRRPWGIGFGSVLQVLYFATGIMIATMFLVAALFIAIWVRMLMFRHEALGRPGGVRMLLG